MEFYSQNFEDVLLARCFADVNNGFYLDVGAQHEEVDSITRYFYDSGWSGINIEPVSEFAKTFECRDRDQTICCAAGSQEATMPLAVSLASGLSSFDQTNAAKIQKMGLLAETRQIRIRTLNSILIELGLTRKDFEFLKVDVEGFELEVIKGIDLHRYRPRIVLCEVTEPNTSNKTSDFDQLCREIESYQYQKLYFDGLNQWWGAAEACAELSEHFVLPPGVMDSPTLTPYSGTLARKQARGAEEVQRRTNEYVAGLQCELDGLQRELEDLHQSLERAEISLNAITNSRNQARNQLMAVYSSHSWKITAPLRRATQLIKMLRNKRSIKGN